MYLLCSRRIIINMIYRLVTAEQDQTTTLMLSSALQSSCVECSPPISLSLSLSLSYSGNALFDAMIYVSCVTLLTRSH
jgi:hypothetical protein